MDKEECKRRLREAMSKKAFPPAVIYPDECRQTNELAPCSNLFARPVLVWVPECVSPNQKPHCVSSYCLCLPRLKEYKYRVVQDVETKVDLLYIKYQCSGSNGYCFSTISANFLQSCVETLLLFPFLTSHMTGYSKRLMELVHDGVMSPSGIASTMADIRRRGQTRYYRLLSLFSDRLRRLRLSNPAYIAPTPPSCIQFCQQNAVPSDQVMTAVWLETTTIWSSLCERLMQNLSVKRALQIDHSVKFCKRLKVWTGSGKRESMSDAKMLLLAQNEIGQIVGRRLTRSKNNEETEELLKWLDPVVVADDPGVCLISDNASAIRKMVSRVFGDRIHVKQDPFHAIQRVRKIDRKLRTPEEMAARFRNVVESVTASDIRCSAEDWRGCCESNLCQINRGDLYVEDNEYCEGGDQVRVVSTSQLEGFHAGLKTLVGRAVSAQLGLRILDIFIVQHNLKIGAKFGRKPAFGDLDFLSLAQAAIVCNGVLPETPPLAFALHVLSEPLVAPQYRSASAIDFDFSKWHQMFTTARVAPDNLEAALTSPHHHYQSVKELLLKSSMSVVANRVDKHTFLASLKLDENDYEPVTGFSAQEYELLRQLQKEQEQMDRT